MDIAGVCVCVDFDLVSMRTPLGTHFGVTGLANGIQSSSAAMRPVFRYAMIRSLALFAAHNGVAHLEYEFHFQSWTINILLFDGDTHFFIVHVDMDVLDSAGMTVAFVLGI